MARPKHDNPNLFTGGELADATGIAPRNVQFLRDNKLGPFAKITHAGGLYGEDTLSELAMIQGCVGAGYALNLSASLVSAFLSENPNHPSARFCFLDRFVSSIAYQAGSWFERYATLRALPSNQPFELTKMHSQDSILVVADREFVLTGTRGKPRLRTAVGPGVNPDGPFALGQMRNLKRGSDPSFTPFWEEIGGALYESPEGVAAEIAYQEAARGAVALVTVNLSLSIRRAFDKVYELRKAKGGPLWEGQPQ